MYEICIVGGGPAGMTAGLYSARAGRKTLLLESGAWGGQLNLTEEIANIPGLAPLPGWELTMRLREQLGKVPVSMENAAVTGLRRQEKHLILDTTLGELKTENVILAMGTRRRMLHVPGEERLQGKGVSWCAVCDGGFFRGKEVAVVGGGTAALEEALYLSRLCSRVFLLVRRDRFRGEARLAERVQKTENIAVMMNTQVQEILGETSVTGLGLSRAGQEEILAVSGVFEAIGGQPDTDWLPDWLPRDENGYLLAGEDCKTPCSGVYAAGDVRKKPLRQVIAAMADGAVAAEAAGKQGNPPTGW